MRVLRTLCTAIALAACVAAPSHAVADEAPIPAPLTMQGRVDLLRADVAEAELSCGDLIGRINRLMTEIDTMLDAGIGNKAELLKLRRALVNTRPLVRCTHKRDLAKSSAAAVTAVSNGENFAR